MDVVLLLQARLVEEESKKRSEELQQKEAELVKVKAEAQVKKQKQKTAFSLFLESSERYFLLRQANAESAEKAKMLEALKTQLEEQHKKEDVLQKKLYLSRCFFLTMLFCVQEQRKKHEEELVAAQKAAQAEKEKLEKDIAEKA